MKLDEYVNQLDGLWLKVVNEVCVGGYTVSVQSKRCGHSEVNIYLLWL